MPASPTRDERRHWLGLLNRATTAELEAGWQALTERPRYRLLRVPETGLVMVRGRAGGTGRRFNLGEMTVTRASVRMDGGAVGHGHVAGRDHQRAERVAVFDALMQGDREAATLRRAVLEPVAHRIEGARAATQRRAAATRVEFFTLARGNNR